MKSKMSNGKHAMKRAKELTFEMMIIRRWRARIRNSFGGTRFQHLRFWLHCRRVVDLMGTSGIKSRSDSIYRRGDSIRPRFDREETETITAKRCFRLNEKRKSFTAGCTCIVISFRMCASLKMRPEIIIIIIE